MVPPELLLVETDAPFLTPVPQPGPAERAGPGGAHAARPGRGPGRPTPPRCAQDRLRANAERVFGAVVAEVRELAVSELAALLGPTDIRELAARLRSCPSKRLGQNFVVDAGTVRRIAAAARLTPADVVLEVGPGFGSLTLPLLGAARPGGGGRDRRGAGRRAARDRRRPAARAGRPA